MNQLDNKTRARILHMLVEGNSLRATARMADVSRNTVDKLLRNVGSACLDYQDKALRDLPCKRIQCDEIWSFVYAKQKNVKSATAAPEGAGDIWTWVSICDDTKLVPCWHVDDRSPEAAMHFMTNLAGRLANRVQLTTDGYLVYTEAVDKAFGGEVDYAMLVKRYGNAPDKTHRYSPGKVVGSAKVWKSGQPNYWDVSTSYVERQNLTMRMSMRRFTRLTNGFSKKVENHMHALSLHYMYYNFGRIHKTLKVTPAMEAGLSDHIWSLEEIAELAPLKAPAKRGAYKRALKAE